MSLINICNELVNKYFASQHTFMSEEMKGKTFFIMLYIIFFKLRLSDINNKKYARLLKGMCEQYLLDEKVNSEDSKLTDYKILRLQSLDERLE